MAKKWYGKLKLTDKEARDLSFLVSRHFSDAEMDLEKKSIREGALLAVLINNNAVARLNFSEEEDVDDTPMWGNEAIHVLEVVVEPGFMWALESTIREKLAGMNQSSESTE